MLCPAATARSVEDETRNAEFNGNRNPEWWGDCSQLRIQIKQKSQFELTARFLGIQIQSKSEFDFAPRNLIFSIFTSFSLNQDLEGLRSLILGVRIVSPWK